MGNCPKYVVGDAKKIKTLVANLTANAGKSMSYYIRARRSRRTAVKYTDSGKIVVECHTFDEPDDLRSPGTVAVEIVVSDTGCGIPSDKLEGIFREFEQVEMDQSPRTYSPSQTQSQARGQGLGQFSFFMCSFLFLIINFMQDLALLLSLVSWNNWVGNCALTQRLERVAVFRSSSPLGQMWKAPTRNSLTLALNQSRCHVRGLRVQGIAS